MPLLRHRPAPPLAPRKRSLVENLRMWTILVVSGVTPLLLIAINVAAYIINHLSEFRWTVAVMSFVSGMCLNTWWVLNIYRTVQRRRPDWSLFNPRNEDILVVAAMLSVTIFTFILAWLTYRQLEDPAKLPDPLTFVYGVLGVILVIRAKIFFDRDRERKLLDAARARPVGTVPPPPPQPGSAGVATQPQYQPPRYLPPS